MPSRWTVQTSNGNGEVVITADPGRPVDLAINRLYTDEPTQLDADTVEDLRRKLGLAVGVANTTP